MYYCVNAITKDIKHPKTKRGMQCNACCRNCKVSFQLRPQVCLVASAFPPGPTGPLSTRINENSDFQLVLNKIHKSGNCIAGDVGWVSSVGEKPRSPQRGPLKFRLKVDDKLNIKICWPDDPGESATRPLYK